MESGKAGMEFVPQSASNIIYYMVYDVRLDSLARMGGYGYLVGQL